MKTEEYNYLINLLEKAGVPDAPTQALRIYKKCQAENVDIKEVQIIQSK